MEALELALESGMKALLYTLRTDLPRILQVTQNESFGQYCPILGHCTNRSNKGK